MFVSPLEPHVQICGFVDLYLWPCHAHRSFIRHGCSCQVASWVVDPQLFSWFKFNNFQRHLGHWSLKDKLFFLRMFWFICCQKLLLPLGYLAFELLIWVFIIFYFYYYYLLFHFYYFLMESSFKLWFSQMVVKFWTTVTVVIYLDQFLNLPFPLVDFWHLEFTALTSLCGQTAASISCSWSVVSFMGTSFEHI